MKYIRAIYNGAKTVSYFSKTSKKSGKETANNPPDWIKNSGKKPLQGESSGNFTKRVLDEKYGKGNWKPGPNTEYSKIKKWIERSLNNK